MRYPLDLVAILAEAAVQHWSHGAPPAICLAALRRLRSWGRASR